MTTETKYYNEGKCIFCYDNIRLNNKSYCIECNKKYTCIINKKKGKQLFL